MKRAVPLTDKVVRGLMVAMSAIDANPPEVLLGYDEPQNEEHRAVLADWEAAERWIRDQCDRRKLA